MPEMETIQIYALVDPRTDEIRYVGKTNQKVETRITGHMNDKSKCHRVNWLNELKKEGLRPDYVILETIETVKEGGWPWQESERFWIARLKRMKVRLTNNTSGGDGVCDLPPETREKMRKTWLGRKHTPETIEKLKAARAKRVMTQETKDRIGAAHKGREITWIDKISKANSKITKEQAVSIKARLDAGEGTCAIAKEFSVHRTTISKIKMGTYFNQKKKKRS